MDLIYLKSIETAVVIVLYIITRYASFRLIDRSLEDRVMHKSRGFIVKRAINLILLTTSAAFILSFWGVNHRDLGVFIGSILTVIGVALFAQWSILSNITASIIIFINHSIRIHDSIVILEGKDYVIEGVVTNIGLFFITLQNEEGEEITLPNNIFLQKSIRNKSSISKE